MDLIANLALGFQSALSPSTLLFCLLGVTTGMVIGALPGIGSLAAVSLLLPVTFYITPTDALVMLAGVYYGAEYGGSIASILLNLPGTTSSIVTCLDGHPLAKQGRAGVALFMTTIASFFGASIGIIVTVLAAPALAEAALAFGPADYFAVMMLGLIAAASVSQGTPIKGVAMVLVGILLGSVGSDVETGATRFTLGFPMLSDGLSLVALAMGLFGISEIIASIRLARGSEHYQGRITLRSMLPARQEARDCVAPMTRGTVIGSLLGALPGTGPTLASFIAYAVEKRTARQPERFGKGALEGIAAPEAANNAAAQTAFIPTLTMGIPGSATMALILGALMIHGVQPGPLIMTKHPEVFWGVIASFWIGNLMLLVLNIPLIGIWVRMLKVPYALLYPVIVCLICTGVYSVNNSVFDVFLVLVIGAVGYGMRQVELDPAPLLIGFILGPMMEENFRRALLLSRGDFWVFLERPISASLLVVTALLIGLVTWRTLAPRLRARSVSGMHVE